MKGEYNGQKRWKTMNATIFRCEDGKSKKQDTDWDLQETEPHSQVFVIQLIPTKK